MRRRLRPQWSVGVALIMVGACGRTERETCSSEADCKVGYRCQPEPQYGGNICVYTGADGSDADDGADGADADTGDAEDLLARWGLSKWNDGALWGN